MRHLSGTQQALLLGLGILLLGAVIVAAYVVHRLVRRMREAGEVKPPRPRPEDPVAFATATFQAVIAGLKAQEKQLREWWEAAENRAEEAARLNEVLAREMPCGLLVFDREGFVKLANPAARAILGIDIWARRRYPEVLGEESPLCRSIKQCLETGKSCTKQPLIHITPSGETRALQVTLSPFLARDGRVGGSVCLFSEPQAAPRFVH